MNKQTNSEQPYMTMGDFGKQLVKDYNIHPDLAVEIEQEAANLYAHPTEDGWCCACDADTVFLEGQIRDAKAEGYQAGIKASLEALPEKMLSASTPLGMPEAIYNNYVGRDATINQTRTNLERLLKR